MAQATGTPVPGRHEVPPLLHFDDQRELGGRNIGTGRRWLKEFG
jgi:hypothetical protein